MNFESIINFIGVGVALWFSIRKGKPVPPFFPGGLPIADILDTIKKFVEGLNIPHDQKTMLAKDLLHTLTAPGSPPLPAPESVAFSASAPRKPRRSPAP